MIKQKVTMNLMDMMNFSVLLGYKGNIGYHNWVKKLTKQRQSLA
jgi:hypothetical protein